MNRIETKEIAAKKLASMNPAYAKSDCYSILWCDAVDLMANLIEAHSLISRLVDGENWNATKAEAKSWLIGA